MILLRGGRVIDPASGTDRVLDILVDGEVIRDIGERLGDAGAPTAGGTGTTDGRPTIEGVRTIDCAGAIVAPGLVDLHVHFREPGREDDETIETGSRAAALGGFTAVCPMPNTEPAQDNASIVEAVARRGADIGLVDVFPIGAITQGRRGDRLAPMGEMHTSSAKVRLFSDDGDPVPTAEMMRRALEYATTFDGVVIDHAEDPSMRNGHMHEGRVSAMLGLPAIAAEAEEICVLRDLALAKLTGGRLHIAHVSTAGAVEAIRRAKAAGIRVTCEATPHHLTLTDEAVRSFDSSFKVAPPLRSADHVAAVQAGLADGTIDAIATDHAPHAPHKKEREFEYAPCGMVGLETALPVVLTELVEPGIVDLQTALAAMTAGPARILGTQDHGGPIAPGRPANLVVIDPEARWTVDPASLSSRSRNTPFAGRKMRGRVLYTLLRGEITVDEGKAVR